MFAVLSNGAVLPQDFLTFIRSRIAATHLAET